MNSAHARGLTDEDERRYESSLSHSKDRARGRKIRMFGLACSCLMIRFQVQLALAKKTVDI